MFKFVPTVSLESMSKSSDSYPEDMLYLYASMFPDNKARLYLTSKD
jgi:hypothetical protein